MDPSSIPGILNLDTLFLFAIFIVPGWLARLFYRRYVPDPAEGFGHELLAVISLSLLFFAPSGTVLIFLESFPALIPLFWLAFAVFGVPIIATYLYLWRIVGDEVSVVEMVFGKAASEQAAEPLPPMPTAFDAVFGSGNQFLVYFKDQEGKSQVGYFGPESHTSPFPNEQQLYLQEVLRSDPSGNLTGRHPAGSPERATGVIIKVAEQPGILLEKLEAAGLPEGSEPLEFRLGEAREIGDEEKS